MTGAANFRDLTIDRIRGALVISMVVGDYLAGVSWVPLFLKHAPDIGFTVADAVAPIFVFLIGWNYCESFQRRLAVNRNNAYRHFVTRYLSLIGIGAVLAAAGSIFDRPANWGVLQSLGVAGLLTLLVVSLRTWQRFLVGSLMLLAYQYLLIAGAQENVLASSHGGVIGALSWSALLILSTAVRDLWQKSRRTYMFCTLVIAALALVSVLVTPVSKNRVSLSYILVTLAISSIVVLVAESIRRASAAREGIFCWWGQNALAMYLLHLVVLGVFALPTAKWWYTDAPIGLVFLQLLLSLALMTLVARRMHKRPLAI